jgi:hypothetical protein
LIEASAAPRAASATATVNGRIRAVGQKVYVNAIDDSIEGLEIGGGNPLDEVGGPGSNCGHRTYLT